MVKEFRANPASGNTHEADFPGLAGEIGLMASRRLLLVEDSSTMRRMLSTLLQEEGYEVSIAKDGKEGLEKVREAPRVDVIVTDYEMPELDGAGLCRALK